MSKSRAKNAEAATMRLGSLPKKTWPPTPCWWCKVMTTRCFKVIRCMRSKQVGWRVRRLHHLPHLQPNLVTAKSIRPAQSTAQTQLTSHYIFLVDSGQSRLAKVPFYTTATCAWAAALLLKSPDTLNICAAGPTRLGTHARRHLRRLSSVLYMPIHHKHTTYWRPPMCATAA